VSFDAGFASWRQHANTEGLLYRFSLSILFVGRMSRAHPLPSTTRNYAWPPLYETLSSFANRCADVVEPASIDLDECIERLYKKELLAESVIEAICAKAKELLMKESNVVHIAAPVTVVGDIHGQFFDMLEIFKIGGFCPNTNYLFLGNDFPSCLSQIKIPPPRSSHPR
jgi:hypothetical protein